MLNDRFNRLVFIICSFFSCFYILPVNASGQAIFTTAAQVLKVKKHGQKIRVDYAVKTTPENSHIPRHKVLSADFKEADLVPLMASLKGRNPGALVVTTAAAGAAAGAGWLIDELTGQITKSSPTNIDDHVEGYYYQTKQASTPSCISPQHCYLIAPQSLPNCGPNGTCPQTSHGLKEIFGRMEPSVTYSNGQTFWWQKKACNSTNPLCNIDPSDIVLPGTNEPVPDEDLLPKMVEELLKMPASYLWDLFRQKSGDPSPNPVIDTTINDWLKEVAKNDPNVEYVGPGRITITNPDGSTTTGEYTPPSEDTANKPDAEPEWPGFCDWASVVCDWIEWTKEEEENLDPDDFPVEELTLDDIKEDYSSGLGAGSCPAPITTSFNGQSIKYEFTVACENVSTYFKPLVISIAGIIATMIIVGAQRRGA
ncbi:virulence factor TspB C-terminal domain-related protein [Marinobacterium stanieri]|uniref:TspB protein n=1 Tax=Marinobacterium stanieri TaxID=49186 RepID=A0A1N6R7B3_9GAMM|nr:virulence factor TspB C-terminal domain-related protein [Marinobacterium stanieri]SIQ24727.1 hypothetical protein SAMN05421647_103153 [Marinobacterium stanieri]